jgi:hypothetical protein
LPAPQVERVQPTVERVYVARWRGQVHRGASVRVAGIFNLA